MTCGTKSLLYTVGEKSPIVKFYPEPNFTSIRKLQPDVLIFWQCKVLAKRVRSCSIACEHHSAILILYSSCTDGDELGTSSLSIVRFTQLKEIVFKTERWRNDESVSQLYNG